MMKRIGLTVAAFAGLAGILMGADFWTQKDYTQWSQEEAIKILTDSPWATVTQFSMGLPAGGGGISGASAGGGPRAGGGMGGMGGDLGDAGGMGGAGGMGDMGGMGGMGGGRGGRGGAGGGMPPAMRVPMRWVSSLPVREATARLQFGDEAATSPKAKEIIERQPAQYVLELTGLPRRMLGEDLQALKAMAAMKIKGVDPVAPMDVQGQPGQQGRPMRIYLLFPKAAEGGHDVTLEDKTVETPVAAAAEPAAGYIARVPL